MPRKTSSNVQLGLFVTIGAALFIGAVYLIGSKQSLFGDTFQIGAVFNNVSGLQKGNNVRYAGINVGTVKDIVFLNDSTVRVDMVVSRKVQPFLKKDAVASIGSDGLVGSMLINITPGNGKAPPLIEGDLLATYSRLKPEEMLSTLGNTNETVALISENLLRLTSQINEGSGTVSLLLYDSLLARELAQSVHNLRLTASYLAETGRQLDQLVAGIQQGEGSLGQLLRDTSLMVNLQTASYRLDTIISEQVDPLFQELNRSARDILVTTSTLRTMVEEVNAGKGPAGVLLRDPEATQNLREILQNLSEASGRLNENMEAMRHNFLFRGYFKKLEKERLR